MNKKELLEAYSNEKLQHIKDINYMIHNTPNKKKKNKKDYSPMIDSKWFRRNLKRADRID
jgi:hypothetical protein